MFFTIILFIFILGLIVFVHELGHFLAARRAGIPVKEFAFGFPPRLWKRTRNQTTYAINLIPLGGYVKLAGEDEESEDPQAFNNQPLRKRALVIVAGVVMNFFLAWFLFTIWIGASTLIKSQNQVVVASIVKGSVAEQVGIQPGDLVINVNSTSAVSATETAEVIKDMRGQSITFTVKRFAKERTFTAQLPDAETPLGISLVDTDSQGTLEQGRVWWYAPWYGLQFFWEVVSVNGQALWGMLAGIFGGTGGEATSGVVGPVGIVAMLSQVMNLGILHVVRFIGVLSLAVGLFNILPFPALDGGRLLFIGIESVFRRRVAGRVEGAVHAAGFIILIVLFLAITYRDIVRLLS